MKAVNFYEDIQANPQQFRQLNCKGMLFAHYSCPQVDLKKEFFSQCNFISYTFRGEKRIHKGTQSWDMEGDVAIFAKKGAYLFEKFENIEHCVMVFFIPDAYLQQVMKEYRETALLRPSVARPASTVVKLDLTNSTRAFFQSMISYFEEPPGENILELKFRELLFNLLANANNRELLAILGDMQVGQRPSLHAVMEENYMYNLTLEDFAKISLRSLASFKRDFTEEFKTTPGRWLLERRLENARLLLTNTTKSLSDVLTESGFENPTHFSRVFRQKYGKSPMQARKEALAIAD